MPKNSMSKYLFYSDALRIRRPTAFNAIIKPVGPVCNLNCSYCYYLEKKILYPGRIDFRMSEEILEEFIRQYISIQEVPVVTFTWQGGEPTLAGIDFFRKAVDLQKKYSDGKSIENSFQTNGTRLDDEWCMLFRENNFLVGISIDGTEHNHDHYRLTSNGKPTFRRVMKSVELLQKHKVEFNTLSTVNSYNERFATETYRFLKSIGSVFMQFLPVVERRAQNLNSRLLSLVTNDHAGNSTVTEWSVSPTGYGAFLMAIFDEWVRFDVGKHFVQIFDATLANYIGERPGICVFAETCGEALAVEHNGDVFSCDHFVYPEYFLGNIMSEPLIKSVKSEKQFNFGTDKRNRLPLYCFQCPVRYACNGECPKHRFLSTPDGKPGLNYLCEGYKAFFTHAEPYVKFMAEELLHKRAPANVMKWIRNRENQIIKPATPGRNDPCSCGSGKKFKNCCAARQNFKL